MVALRKQSAIIERSFVSTWSGRTYTGWYLDGRMVGCSCPWKCNHAPHQECKHQIQHNAAMQAITGEDLPVHIEEELLNSCCTCGYLTKGVICFRCLQ